MLWGRVKGDDTEVEGVPGFYTHLEGAF